MLKVQIQQERIPEPWGIMENAQHAFDTLLNSLRMAQQQARATYSQVQASGDADLAAAVGRRIAQIARHIQELENLQRRWGDLVDLSPEALSEAVTPQEDFFVPILRALARFGEPAKVPWVLGFVERVMESELTLEDWNIIATRPLILWQDTVKCAAQQLIDWGLIQESQSGRWELSSAGAAQLAAYRQTGKPIGKAEPAKVDGGPVASSPPETEIIMVEAAPPLADSGGDDVVATNELVISEGDLVELQRVEVYLAEHLSRHVRKRGRTRDLEFVIPFLQAVEDLGGSAKVGRVIDRVGEIMHDQLKRVDWEPASSGYQYLWQRNVYKIYTVLRKCGLVKNVGQRTFHNHRAHSPNHITLTDLGRKYIDYQDFWE